MRERNDPCVPQEELWSRLSEALGRQMGLHYPKERWRDLERGLAAATAAFGMASVGSCARWLLSAPLTRAQIEVLADCLTVGETYFFRERASFDVFEQRILPQLQARRRAQRRLRLWSAGCCSGEEPYSIAISIARTIPDWREWNISILATDIDPRVLRKAESGIYGDWSFRDSLPEVKAGFFRKTKDGRFQIDQHIKALVSFDYLNLVEDAYPSLENGTNAMDVVFCRNVVMYFDAPQAGRVLQRLGRSLVDGGWLFVNPVEIPHTALPQLVPIDFSGVIVHRKDAHRPLATAPSPVSAPPAWASTQGPPAPAAPQVEVWPAFDQPLHDRAETGPASAPAAQSPEESGSPSHRRAGILYEQGRYAEAVHELLHGLSLTPDDAPTMALLARSYANEGRLDKATHWCNRALAADKLNAGWHYLLATILQEQDRLDEATESLRRALYLDQDNALAHFALGNLIRRQGKTRDAERHFRNALAILVRHPQDQVLPESEGITAGRLVQIIRSAIASEACT